MYACKGQKMAQLYALPPVLMQKFSPTRASVYLADVVWNAMDQFGQAAYPGFSA